MEDNVYAFEEVTYVVFPLDLKVLVNLKGVPSRCELLHIFECPCLFAQQHLRRRKEFYDTMAEWQNVEEQIVSRRSHYQNLELLSNLKVEKTDRTVILDLHHDDTDCFSLKTKRRIRSFDFTKHTEFP